MTEVGIERLDGTYEIPASDISDVSDTHSIAQHVCDKGWADTDDFVTAWMVALTMHGVRVPKSRVRRALSKCVVRTPEAAAAWKKPRRPCAPEQPEQPERDDALAWLWSRVDSLREALGGCHGGAS